MVFNLPERDNWFLSSTRPIRDSPQETWRLMLILLNYSNNTDSKWSSLRASPKIWDSTEKESVPSTLFHQQKILLIKSWVKSSKGNFWKIYRLVVRPMYSSPQLHGARIAAKILSNPTHYNDWKVELKAVSERIQ